MRCGGGTTGFKHGRKRNPAPILVLSADTAVNPEAAFLAAGADESRRKAFRRRRSDGKSARPSTARRLTGHSSWRRSVGCGGRRLNLRFADQAGGISKHWISRPSGQIRIRVKKHGISQNLLLLWDACFSETSRRRSLIFVRQNGRWLTAAIRGWPLTPTTAQ